MIYYIGDMHLGHKKVIEYDKRPFSSLDEMDNILIMNWNNKVSDEDHIYVIGDFTCRSEHDAGYYLKQLNGHKHLISGNHDLKTLEDKEAMSFFESVEKLGYVKDNGRDVVMCHYPLAEWNGCRRNKNPSYHVYSHIHNRINDTSEFMKSRKYALNSGCMINGYTPCTLDELIVNNHKWQDVCMEKIKKSLIGTYLPTYIPEINAWGVDTGYGVEVGNVSYITAEFCRDSVLYLFYDKYNKEHPNHVHGDFEYVIETLLNSPEDFSIEGFEKLYSIQERRVLMNIRNTINQVRQTKRPVTKEDVINRHQ